MSNIQKPFNFMRDLIISKKQQVLNKKKYWTKGHLATLVNIINSKAIIGNQLVPLITYKQMNT